MNINVLLLKFIFSSWILLFLFCKVMCLFLAQSSGYFMSQGRHMNAKCVVWLTFGLTSQTLYINEYSDHVSCVTLSHQFFAWFIQNYTHVSIHLKKKLHLIDQPVFPNIFLKFFSIKANSCLFLILNMLLTILKWRGECVFLRHYAPQNPYRCCSWGHSRIKFIWFGVFLGNSPRKIKALGWPEDQ